MTYLAISPVGHALNWQMRPVDRSSLPPYWESQKDDHSPKGSNDSESRLDCFRGLGGRDALSAGFEVGFQCGRGLGRLMVSNFARHGRDMLCALETHRQSKVFTRVAGVESGRLKAEKGGTGGTAEGGQALRCEVYSQAST